MRTPRIGYDDSSSGFGTAVDCPPRCEPCPICRQLECLCRPRFFAGQLLTEAELNGLDRYVRAKNRLHTRHLHDWGTVCGLEVSCGPCDDGTVRVSPGYAVDPCGNDIVVCDADVVDVCDLIDRCRRDERPQHCEPGDLRSSTWTRKLECEDDEETWILALRYHESPSRGITALRSPVTSTCAGCAKPAASCGGRCGCGGKNGGAKNGKQAKNAGHAASAGSCAACAGTEAVSTQRPPRRASPPACEPSVVCEGYVYEVYRVREEDSKTDDKRKTQIRGPLVDRFQCCMQAVIKAIPKPPGEFTEQAYQADPRSWHRWVAAFKRNLLELLERYPGYDCELARQVQRTVIPNPSSNTPDPTIGTALLRLAIVLMKLLLECLCAAMLPPCPAPATDARVALASITVRRKGCKVIKICNWTLQRRIAMTIPNLRYWLSVLSITPLIRQMLHELCCVGFDIQLPGDDRRETDDTEGARRTVSARSRSRPADAPPPAAPSAAPAAPPPPAAEPAAAAAPLQPPDDKTFAYVPEAKVDDAEAVGAFSTLLRAAALRGNQGFDVLEMVSALLAGDGGDQGEQKGLLGAERDNFAHFLLLRRVAMPILSAAGGEGLAALLAGLGGGKLGMGLHAAAFGGTATSDDERLSALELKLASQDQEIAELKKKLGQG
jgi:hypothetical protein